MEEAPGVPQKAERDNFLQGSSRRDETVGTA